MFYQKLSNHFPKMSSNSSIWILTGNQVTENTQTNAQVGSGGAGVVTTAL